MVRQDGARLARVLLALALTAAAVFALYWGFIKNDPGDGASGMRVELDFEGLPNGSPPGNFDTGQVATASATALSSGAPFVIRGGKLTYEPITNDVWAADLSTPDMKQPVSSLGGTFVFGEPTPEGGAGAVTFAVSRNVAPTFPQAVAPIPVNLVMTPANWKLSVGKDPGSPMEDIAAADFTEPLKQDGQTPYTVSIRLDGGQVTIELPDGSRPIVKDARISEWAGDYATFGLYSNNGQADSVGGFRQVWADSAVGS